MIPSGRKERAVKLINGLMNELVELRFSYREIKSMVDLVVLEREEQLESLSIAVVDCSPEALAILYRQLGILSRINSRTILLGDLASSGEPEKRLSGFDLILTTATHYGDVLAMAPGLKERIMRVVVSPSQETIIHLAALKPSQTDRHRVREPAVPGDREAETRRAGAAQQREPLLLAGRWSRSRRFWARRTC